MPKNRSIRRPAIIQHGWHVLPRVVVDAYNEELKDEDGFLGDRASKGAFREILDKWRKEVAHAATIRSATRRHGPHQVAARQAS